ncbi:hypothetical protein [Sulfurospirillum sp. 1612]|uniref:hypothetical protein n=1 Tax=Sulfurospirillum sp. 1612 TaxID=3094835 RepID=UPI002F95D979
MQLDTTINNTLKTLQNSTTMKEKSVYDSQKIETFQSLLEKSDWQSGSSAEYVKIQTPANQADVSNFLSQLHDKGAIQFFTDLNQEKIDKKIEEYRQKLEDKMGDNPESSQKIEKLVEDYRKQIIEDLKEQMRAKQEEKGQETRTPFEILLQA